MSEIEKKQSDENIINKENIKEEIENEDDDDLKNFKNLINIECNKLKSLSNEIIDIYKVIQKKRQSIFITKVITKVTIWLSRIQKIT